MKSRKEAFDDAISATKAAIAEGIVPGGGLALLRAIDAVEREEQRLRRRRAHRPADSPPALEAPTRQIAENSGVDGGVVVDRMRTGTGNFGFDAARNVYVDLIEAGIIDPTKVVRVGARECRLGCERAAVDRGDADRGAGSESRVRRPGDGVSGSRCGASRRCVTWPGCCAGSR